MDFKVLKSFLAVCEHGSITKAAKAISISQSALTRQMQDLEVEMGCRLFVRGKPVSLTESGFLFHVRVKEIISMMEHTKRELSASRELLGGIVRIGCVESTASEVLADMVAGFSAEFPHVCFDLYTGDGDDLRNYLDEDKLDLAVLLEPVETAKYDRLPFPARDRWVIVRREADIPAEKSFYTGADLKKLPLIVSRRHIVMDDLCAWFGVAKGGLRVIACQNLASNGLALVERGAGAMLTVEWAFTSRVREGLKCLPVRPERIVTHVMVRKKGRKLSRSAEKFWNKASSPDSKNPAVD